MKNLIFIILLFVATLASGQDEMFYLAGQTVPTTLKQNLIAAYKLDETSGYTAYDSYTVDATTDMSNQNATVNQSGKFGTSYSFDGAWSFLHYDGAISTLTNNFSMSAWIYPAALNTVSTVFHVGRDNSTTDGDGYSFGISNGSGINGSNLHVLIAGIAWYNTGYTFSSTNAWYNVIIVRDNGTMKAYVNGTQTANTSSSTPRTPTEVTTIGADSYSGSQYRHFNGKIDEVYFWSKVLNSTEINQLQSLPFSSW